MQLHIDKISWPLFCTKSCNFQPPFFPLWFTFILSAFVLLVHLQWSCSEHGESSGLSNVVQIARRMSMGRTLSYPVCFCSFASTDSTLHLKLSSVLFCFTDSVKWMNSCWPVFSLFSMLDSKDRPWLPGHIQQDVDLFTTAFTLLAAVNRLSKGSIFPWDIFLFVCCFQNIFLPVQTYRNILRWERKSGSVACSWWWHSILWYSNGVIHQQALLKHLDKPAEATPVAMVTILKVDLCYQTVAAACSTPLTCICYFV